MPTAVDEQTTDEQAQENGKERKAKTPKEQRISAYVVFGYQEDADEQVDPFDAHWIALGEYEVVGNGGQKDARRQALNDPENADLRTAVLDGGTVHMFCVPKQSFQPHPVRLDAPSEPKIIV